MRRKLKNKNIVEPDIKFKSLKVSKLINHVMDHGKRQTAQKVDYDSFDIIKERENVENPLEVFDTALKNSAPAMEVRSRRVGGANYQVPREVRPERRAFLAMTWLIKAARKKKGKAMRFRLADEIILASKGEGEAVKKKEDTHKMAEANKAFAHFAW